jgi:thiol-disulfide isomerase/thioredoxin
MLEKKSKNMKKDGRMCTSTMKMIVIAAVIGMFILSFSFAYAWGKYEDQIESRASTTVFETVNLEDFEGNSFTMKDLEGTKLVAYNVWETTCPACLSEMGDLEKLSKEYDSSEFKLIGMCADLYDSDGKIKPEQLEKAKELMQNAGVTFPNLVPDKGFMDFYKSTIAGFPTTFFVNSEGKLIDATAGSKSLEKWEEYVNAELEKMQ